MARTTVGALLLLAVSLPGGCGTPEEREERALTARATAIHERVLTLDTHIDIPLNFATRAVDPGVSGDFQVDLPKMRAGGLDAGFFIVYVGQTERTPENEAQAKADAMTKFEAIHRMAEELYPDEIEIAYTAADVERIAGSGKLVAAIGIENGYVIGRDLSLLETYHELGARYMTLAHGGHNDIADSATPRDALGDGAAEHDGVSAFGERVIGEMNRLGMLVDVSHISRAAMLDAVRLSEAPVVASHSSMHALMPHPPQPGRRAAPRPGRQRGRRSDRGPRCVPLRDGRPPRGGVSQHPRCLRYDSRPAAGGPRGRAVRGLHRPDGGARCALPGRDRGRFRRSHRPRGKPDRNRPRGNQLRFRWRRRHPRLERRERDPERHHRVGASRIQRGAHREAVGGAISCAYGPRPKRSPHGSPGNAAPM